MMSLAIYIGAGIYIVGHGGFVITVIFNCRNKELSPVLLRFGLCCYMIIFGAPAIGGFVVVSKMLKAYGFCY